MRRAELVVYVAVRERTFPDDLILVAVSSENFVQDCLCVMDHPPIQVHIEPTAFSEQLSQQRGPFVKPLQI